MKLNNAWRDILQNIEKYGWFCVGISDRDREQRPLASRTRRAKH